MALATNLLKILEINTQQHITVNQGGRKIVAGNTIKNGNPNCPHIVTLLVERGTTIVPFHHTGVLLGIKFYWGRRKAASS